MKEGPYKVTQTSPKALRTLAAPGTIVTANDDGRCTIGIDAIAAQLNRAHEAGFEEGKRKLETDEASKAQIHATQRDGWRAIAEALMAIGLGYEMRGFGDMPPREIIDEIKDRQDGEVLGAIRDALFGRAWRVRGNDARGMCDYPLCPCRALTSDGRPSLETKFIPGGAILRVCSIAPDGASSECLAWASWVNVRARDGRIKLGG